MATTTVTPGALVAPPGRLPWPYGLFSVVPPRPDTEGRWQSGVTWEGAPCGELGGIGAYECAPDTETVGLPKDLGKNGGPIGSASPFTVYGHSTCSAIAHFNIAQDRATEHLQAREETRVEQAIWTGDLGNFPNFQDAAVNTGGATSPHAVLAAMTGFIRTHYGTAGVLHVGPDAAAVLKAEHLISEKGGRWTTMFGDQVVIGFGYKEHAGGPVLGAAAGGSAWVVMTPPMLGYRSDVFTSSNRPGDLMDRAQNDITAIAERTYLYGWDEGCGGGIIAMQMSLVGHVDTGGA